MKKSEITKINLFCFNLLIRDDHIYTSRVISIRLKSKFLTLNQMKVFPNSIEYLRVINIINV